MSPPCPHVPTVGTLRPQIGGIKRAWSPQAGQDTNNLMSVLYISSQRFGRAGSPRWGPVGTGGDKVGTRHSTYNVSDVSQSRMHTASAARRHGRPAAVP